jgi:hypothetical protein
MRGLQVLLILLIIWFSVVLFSSHLEDPISQRHADHAKLTHNLAVAPLPGLKAESEPAGPQTVENQPGSKLKNPGEIKPPVVKNIAPAASRAPVRVASLIKRKNLEVVIDKYAREYGVDPDLIWAVMRQESGFNPEAVSPKGAMGLMQLMPGTAALMGVSDPFDVEQNIAGGVKYLEQCLDQFNQNVPLALAAYNAGPANVVKYQGCPPFSETKNYVASILAAYAGEPIRSDLKLWRVNYIINEDQPTSVRPRGLPWKIPLPNWKIVTPKSNLGPPHWKVTVRPF